MTGTGVAPEPMLAPPERGFGPVLGGFAVFEVVCGGELIRVDFRVQRRRFVADPGDRLVRDPRRPGGLEFLVRPEGRAELVFGDEPVVVDRVRRQPFKVGFCCDGFFSRARVGARGFGARVARSWWSCPTGSSSARRTRSATAIPVSVALSGCRFVTGPVESFSTAVGS